MAKPATPTERAVNWRKDMIEKGYQQKAFLLSKDALKALAKLKGVHGTERDAVEHALIETAKAGKGKR